MTNWIALSKFTPPDYAETDYGLLASQAIGADWDTLVVYAQRVIEEEERLVGMIQQDAKYLLGMLALEVTKRNENGDKRTLKDFAQATGKNYSTLRTYAQVAAAYEEELEREELKHREDAEDEAEESVRRRTNLSFSHYQEAAAQPDREELIQEASDNNWSVSQLRKHIRDRKEVPVVEEAQHQGQEEILQKVKILAESVPSYEVFEERFEEYVGKIEDPHTKAAINTMVKQNYRDQLKRDQPQVQKRGPQYKGPSTALKAGLKDKVSQLTELQAVITELAQLQRDGPIFRELAADVQSLLAQHPDSRIKDQVGDAISFIADGVGDAVGYLKEVARELGAYEQG
jgi:hypothetical protein